MRTEARRAALAAMLWFGAPCAVAAQPGIYAYTADDGTLTLSDAPGDARYKLVLRDPGAYTLRNPQGAELEGPEAAAATVLALETRPYHAEIVTVAQSHGLDPALLHAMILAESAYNSAAISKAGAVGLMQLMPDTARRYGVRDSLDPRQNIAGGARYLTDLLRLFEGDLELVLAAYNAGENAVLRYGRRIPPYPETRAYVPRVLAFYRRYARPAAPRYY